MNLMQLNIRNLTAWVRAFTKGLDLMRTFNLKIL